MGTLRAASYTTGSYSGATDAGDDVVGENQRGGAEAHSEAPAGSGPLEAENRTLRWAQEVEIALAPMPPLDILRRLADRHHGNSASFVSEFGRRVYGGTKARPSALDERGRPIQRSRQPGDGADAPGSNLDGSEDSEPDTEVPLTESVLVAVLRHQFTNYDSLLEHLARRPGSDLAYPVLKERVNTICRRELAAMKPGGAPSTASVCDGRANPRQPLQ